MKKLLFFVFIGLSLQLSAQEYVLHTTISSKYSEANWFSVYDSNGDFISEFVRNKGQRKFYIDSTIFTLKHRKTLMANGDTLAVYKRGKIILPGSSEKIQEVELKNGWGYVFNGERILTVMFEVDRANDAYLVQLTSSDWNAEVEAATYIALGRFDKNVVMSYEIFTDEVLDVMFNILFFFTI